MEKTRKLWHNFFVFALSLFFIFQHRSSFVVLSEIFKAYWVEKGRITQWMHRFEKTLTEVCAQQSIQFFVIFYVWHLFVEDKKKIQAFVARFIDPLPHSLTDVFMNRCTESLWRKTMNQTKQKKKLTSYESKLFAVLCRINFCHVFVRTIKQL